MGNITRNYLSIISGIIAVLIAWVTMLIIFVGNGPAAYLIALAGIIISLIVLVVPSHGWKGLKDYAGSLLRWRVGARWYLLAILLPLCIEIIALAIFSLGGGKLPPVSAGTWNWPYVTTLLIGFLFVLALTVAIAGFVLSRTPVRYSAFTRGLIFCAALIGGMAPIILAAIANSGSNLWLFTGLIPVAFIALWIYRSARESLLVAGLFILAFFAFQLLSPANWFLSYHREARIIGDVLYFLIAAALVLADRGYFFSPPGREGRRPGPARGKSGVSLPLMVFAAVALAAVISLIYITSISSAVGYPEPTGPYKVGKTAYDLVDQSRDEIATGNATKRELMVYVWYPAAVTGDMKEVPVTDEKTAVALKTGSTFSLGFLKDISDHTYKDPLLAANSSPYPVLLMSHGDSSSPLQMTVTATDLASHGYVVVGISHTYNAEGTVFPDGRVVRRDTNYTPSEPYNFSLSYYENSKNENRHGAEAEQRLAADISFVLDRLEQLNQSDPRFEGKLDLGRVAAFGHSFGGASAVLSAEQDDRIKAAVDVDGAVYHNVSTAKPTMLMLRGSLLNYNRSYDQINQRLLTPEQFSELKNEWDGYEDTVFTNPPTSYYVVINGTEHANFKDFGALNIPIDTGPIDGRYASKIIDSYLLAFFDKYLNGTDSPLLDGKQAYPEVVFKAHVDGKPVTGAP